MKQNRERIKQIIMDTVLKVKERGAGSPKEISLDSHYRFSKTMDYYHEYIGAYVFALRYMSCGETGWDRRMDKIVDDLAILYGLYDSASWVMLEWLIALRFAWLCLDLGEEALNAIGLPKQLSEHIDKCEKSVQTMTLLRPTEHRWEDCIYEIDGIQVESEGHETREVWLNEKYLDESYPIKTGQIIFDLGAYKGESALWYSAKVTKNGYVYACEMIPENIDILHRNIKRNGLEACVEIIPYAIGTFEKGYYSDRLNPSGYILESSGNHSVETVTLDDVVCRKKIERVDWIKMDIEGGERNALISATETIKRDKPSLAIAAYHSLDDYRRLAETILEIDPGYKLFISHKVLSPIETTIFAHHCDRFE